MSVNPTTTTTTMTKCVVSVTSNDPSQAPSSSLCFESSLTVSGYYETSVCINSGLLTEQCIAELLSAKVLNEEEVFVHPTGVNLNERGAGDGLEDSTAGFMQNFTFVAADNFGNNLDLYYLSNFTIVLRTESDNAVQTSVPAARKTTEDPTSGPGNYAAGYYLTRSAVYTVEVYSALIVAPFDPLSTVSVFVKPG